MSFWTDFPLFSDFISFPALLAAGGWGLTSVMAIHGLHLTQRHHVRSISYASACTLVFLLALYGGARQHQDARGAANRWAIVQGGISKIEREVGTERNAPVDQVLAAAAAKLLKLQKDQSDAAAKILKQDQELAKMRERQDWRTLSSASVNTLKSILEGAGSHSFSIRWTPNDPEAESLSKALAETLESAHWTVVQFGSLGLVIGAPSAFFGVEIEYEANPAMDSLLRPFVAALAHSHIAVQRTVHRVTKVSSGAALLLLIGTKPPNPTNGDYLYVP